jgi:ApbE superfamily uncharacterized protein (UPF0280 family)
MGNNRWTSFRSAWRETDLWVAIDSGHYRKEAERFTIDRILSYRAVLEKHIAIYPEFGDSLVPVVAPAGVHPLIYAMSEAALSAGTGPMSAVAGAMAEFICNDLLEEFHADEVVVENGGDIFMKLVAPATVAVYAGDSTLSGRIALQPGPQDSPIALCCSSGTVGHSLSFGVADACMIACRNGALADAYATAFCNEIKDKSQAGPVTEKALKTKGVMAAVIIKDDQVSMGGSLEIKIL